MRHLQFVIAASSVLVANPAFAQQQPMAEVLGQPITVTTDGITNTLYFEADGSARVLTPNATTFPARWSMQGQNLCLSMGEASECWAYSPFELLQPRTMQSSCNATSVWTAQNTNRPQAKTRGERGK